MTRDDIKLAFPEGLNLRQIWALVKIAKHVRLRARNNAAFNNFFNALFPDFKFKQVTKTCFRCQGKGCYSCKNVGSYEGLEITDRSGQKIEEESDGAS